MNRAFVAAAVAAVIPFSAAHNPWTTPVNGTKVPISAADTAAARTQMTTWTKTGHPWWMNGGHDGRAYSSSISWAPAGAVVTPIRLTTVPPGPAAARLSAAFAAFAAGVPLPVGWELGFDPNDVDRELVVAQRQANGAVRYWELYDLRRDAIGVVADWGAYVADTRLSTGTFPDGTGAMATSLALAPSMILDRELRAGVIPHAIGLIVPGSTGFRWPASRTDDIPGLGGAIPAGARLRLDPKLDLRKLPSVGAATPTRNAIALAMQKYGVIVDDQSGGSRILRVENVASPFDWHGSADAMLASIPDSAWQVVSASWRP